VAKRSPALAVGVSLQFWVGNFRKDAEGEREKSERESPVEEIKGEKSG